MKRILLPMLLLAAAGQMAGCDDGGGGGGGGGSDAGSDGSVVGDGGGSDSCAGNTPHTVDVNANITTNTTWCTGNTYRLQNRIYVVGGVTLTVQPGVTVTSHPDHASALYPDAALVITKGSQINAVGTAAQPIVFTSYAPAGQRNVAGVAFGGLVMFGNAPVNNAATAGGEVTMEGLAPVTLTVNGQTVDANNYGGSDAASSCGTLKYVRVEWAGYSFAADKEFNGITLGGCGTGTSLSYVQVHRSWDDGIEVFGGAPNLDHIVLTGSDDDGFDWDNGFAGNVQYMIVHQYGLGNSDKGIEADNNAAGTVTGIAAQRTNPEVYNISLVGPGATRAGQRCMHMRRGTLGRVRHFVCDGWGDNAGTTTADTTPGIFNEPPTTANEANYASHWPTDLALEYGFFRGMIIPRLDYTGCSGGDCATNGSNPIVKTKDGVLDTMADQLLVTASAQTFDSPTLFFDAARHNDLGATVPAAPALIQAGASIIPGAGVVGTNTSPSYCPAAATVAVTDSSTHPAWVDAAGMTFAGACTDANVWYSGWTNFADP